MSYLPMMLSVPDRGRSEIARDRRKCEQNQTFDSIRVTIVAYGEAKTSAGDNLQKAVRKWLSPPDPSINHNIACESHHGGTATWFTEGDVYMEWKAQGSLAWIHGKRMFPPSPCIGCR